MRVRFVIRIQKSVLLPQLVHLMVGRFDVLCLWQDPFCAFFYFFLKRKNWHQSFEPKVMPCLPQHFKYYVRTQKHSHSFPSWFQPSSVPRDLSQASNGSQASLPVCRVSSDKYRVILLFFKAVTALAPTQLMLQAKQLKILISLRCKHRTFFSILKVRMNYTKCLLQFLRLCCRKVYVIFSHVYAVGNYF